MFKAVQFPAGIADLDPCLPHVDRDALALGTRTETENSFMVKARCNHMVCKTSLTTLISNDPPHVGPIGTFMNYGQEYHNLTKFLKIVVFTPFL